MSSVNYVIDHMMENMTVIGHLSSAVFNARFDVFIHLSALSLTIVYCLKIVYPPRIVHRPTTFSELCHSALFDVFIDHSGVFCLFGVF